MAFTSTMSPLERLLRALMAPARAGRALARSASHDDLMALASSAWPWHTFS